jgi:hypothetical protein
MYAAVETVPTSIEGFEASNQEREEKKSEIQIFVFFPPSKNRRSKKSPGCRSNVTGLSCHCTSLAKNWNEVE